MEKKKVVLHVNGRLDIGGAESRIMDLYRNIDREKVQFVFCQHTSDRCAFQEEIEQLGGTVYHVPRFRVINYFAYKKAWKELFKQHPEIDIVHGHMTSTAAIYLPIAKRMGIKTTVAHARSAGTEKGIKGFLTRALRRNLSKKSDVMLSCSILAGEAVFGTKAMREGRVIPFPNAIDVDKFAYNASARDEVRAQLNIEDKFVIGHVGSFLPVKNHKYLLEILKEYICLEAREALPETVLLLLGDGPLKPEIQKMAEDMGIASRVIFMGNRKDVYRFYQAMDYFLLPSFYEGLPGTAVEAQASGLYGMISDTITTEAVITERFQREDISKEPGLWAEKIAEAVNRTGDCKKRSLYSGQIKNAGFDVKEQVMRIQNFYLNGTWE